MTYNAIILLSKSQNISFEYSVLEKTNDIETSLLSDRFNKLIISALKKDRWLLLSPSTKEKIEKIVDNWLGAQIESCISTIKNR